MSVAAGSSAPWPCHLPGSRIRTGEQVRPCHPGLTRGFNRVEPVAAGGREAARPPARLPTTSWPVSTNPLDRTAKTSSAPSDICFIPVGLSGRRGASADQPGIRPLAAAAGGRRRLPGVRFPPASLDLGDVVCRARTARGPGPGEPGSERGLADLAFLDGATGVVVPEAAPGASSMPKTSERAPSFRVRCPFLGALLRTALADSSVTISR